MEAAERGRRGSRRQDKAVRHRRMLGIRAAVGILCGMVLCAVLSVGSSMCVRAEEIMALSGTFGKNGGLRWVMDEGTKTITISGQDEVEMSSGASQANAFFNPNVEYIKFDSCKMSGSMGRLFASLAHLKGIDFNGLDTGSVTNMGDMFSGCSGLTVLHTPVFMGDSFNAWLPAEYYDLDAYKNQGVLVRKRSAPGLASRRPFLSGQGNLRS